METLVKVKRKSKIFSVLSVLPDTVDESYNAAIERIKCQSQDDIKLAFQIISWITQAYRHLTIKELAYALEMTDGNFDNMEDCLSEEEIISCCQGLVELKQNSREVSLVRECLLYLFT